jgi:hypothetical protein
MSNPNEIKKNTLQPGDSNGATTGGGDNPNVVTPREPLDNPNPPQDTKSKGPQPAVVTPREPL